MWYVAFTLGLFGSLHCVGMCGPLAIVFSNKERNSRNQNIVSALSYNLGRTATYSLLGLFFGILGSFLFVADLQKVASIVLGVFLIAAFIFNIDIDKSVNQNSVIKKFYFSVRAFISEMMQKSQNYHSFQLGMANGLLPCGLVYLALAGALASGSVMGGIAFMAFFGLGTIPMLFVLSSGYSLVSSKVRFKFRKILPYVTFIFGAFLIYRGIIVDMPTELNFWEVLKNPIMCH